MQSTRTENAWAALISAARKAAELITLLCNALEKEVEDNNENN